MLVRRHNEIRIINSVLSDIFSHYISRGDFFEDSTLKYLNVEKDGKTYALYYSGDNENRPFIQIPDRIEFVGRMLRAWFMFNVFPTIGGPIKKAPDWDPRMEYFFMYDEDRNYRELEMCLDKQREAINANYSYVFAEGYLASQDHKEIIRLFTYEMPHEGHDVFEYDSSTGDSGRYFTEPVPTGSPYYIGEEGGKGLLTLKISNPEWWLIARNKAASKLFLEGCKTEEKDPESRKGSFKYDFVIKDVPMDEVYCPQNYWDLSQMLVRLIKEEGLIYTVEEQEKSYRKGNKQIKPLVDFWGSFYSNYIIGKFKHLIWEVHGTEHGIIQRYEYKSKLQHGNYGGQYTTEIIAN